MMMKKVYASLAALLCGGMLTGCGSTFTADTSTVYVDKNGKVISVDVEDLDQSYYDAEELKTFVDDTVESYVSENGKGTVSVLDLSTVDGIATLRMEFESADDYANFNGIELYQGKVVKALASGYDFNVDFAKVENGEVVGEANKEDIYAGDDLKIVIIRANTDVKVEGEIQYISCENVKLLGTDTVSIRNGYGIDTYWKPAAEEAVEGTEMVEDTESVEDTEELGGSISVEQSTETDSAPAASETDLNDDSFETDVYTYIVYK